MEYFTFGDDKEGVNENIIPRQRLQIEGLKFKKGKWELSDGAHINWYTMDDQEFLQAIEKGKTFGKYDILICEVLMTQHIQSDGKLKSEYTVKRVLKHSRPGEQLPLNNYN